MSSRLPHVLLVGVGGNWGSKPWSDPCLPEFEIDDDRLEAPLEAAFSRIASEGMEAELGPLLSRHFRENEGRRVPNRVARPVSGDSTALRFLYR
jgi:hypothetical protein